MFELQGKTVAIDLSCWVVDSQTVVDNAVQPKMYLRNLYFRTAFLLLQGIWPVFVLEGKAHIIRHNTIAKRNDIRNGFRQRKTSHKGARSQLNRILKECKEMLIFMGLACVQGHGEAEAMCAYLNDDGLVDGCISQDSDCFLYGAKVVYRNFCTSAQGNRGGTGGSIDKYSLEKIERQLNLGRNKMIALALLCGCDYNDGLNGVGYVTHYFSRIKSWRTDSSLDQKETELQCSNLCTSCGHDGKVQKHAKSGCVDCGTAVRCNNSYKEKRALILNEIALRKKALLIEDFPSQELLDEFLIRKDLVPRKVDLQWKKPQISKLIDFMEGHLSWEPQYAFEKVFPLVTRWQLLHLPNISLEDRLLIPDLFEPEAIKNIRNIKSVASYEIMWHMDHDVVEKLKEYMASYTKQNDSTHNSVTELTSIEPQYLVLNCYPEIVEAFENVRSVKAKKRPTKKKAENETNGKDTGKGKKKEVDRQKKVIENNRRTDEFVSKNTALSVEESFEETNITPKRSKRVEKQQENQNYSGSIKRRPQFDKVLQLEKLNSKLNRTLDRMFNELLPDDFISDNEEQDLNMSEIIDNICSVKKVFQFNSISVDEITSNVKSTENCNMIHTVSYSEAESNKCETSIAICDQSNDEFSGINDSYIPLNQRLLTLKNRNELPIHFTEINERFTLGFVDLMSDTDP
ncbi:Flap endonuclease GEN [Dufourea novaeangliae]|uniref:Flap endonuclease GEN n=1 Tax=Dufourea novaeangliae TaxID=178035 RepID=A0A154P969_DUFNO|nr:Flap endonuclease GEN [Dufourea novaeangliae]